MERKGLVLGMLAAALAAGLSTGAGAQDKKDAGAATGPYGLPSFAAVKDKVKPTDDEAKKIEEVYAQGSKNEAESKNRAKENGTDGKTLAGYLSQGRIETMNKVKEVLDKDKSKLFDDLCRASQPDKKKK
ncbi:MAG TPA: hypothetical protein VKW04_05710 [Planctomycetota bacterium]|jgi:hypothetical protein|nr:hypothetical protein [Planctomycetota bacterium]